MIASDGGSTIDLCACRNPLLATAGSGDVLTGVIAALLCHAGAREAACAGAYLHALAAEVWAEKVGADRGMLAGEIAEHNKKFGVPDGVSGAMIDVFEPVQGRRGRQWRAVEGAGASLPPTNERACLHVVVNTGAAV